MAQSAPSKIVRPVRRGQITIPIEFRRKLGIKDDSLLQLTLHEDRIEVEPVIAQPAKGSAWARELYEMFAPVRADLAALSEDEINALIDEALSEVRVEQDATSSS